jgi:hypothetical protein
VVSRVQVPVSPSPESPANRPFRVGQETLREASFWSGKSRNRRLPDQLSRQLCVVWTPEARRNLMLEGGGLAPPSSRAPRNPRTRARPKPCHFAVLTRRIRRTMGVRARGGEHLDAEELADEMIELLLVPTGHSKVLLFEPDHDRRPEFARRAAASGWLVPSPEAQSAGPVRPATRRFTDKEEVPGSSPGSPIPRKDLEIRHFLWRPDSRVRRRRPLKGCIWGASDSEVRPAWSAPTRAPGRRSGSPDPPRLGCPR